MVGQRSPAKPAKNVMERLCCDLKNASAILKHVSVEPCAVFAKDDQDAREVKDWISANKSDAPITHYFGNLRFSIAFPRYLLSLVR